MPTRLHTQQRRLQLEPVANLPSALGGGWGGVLVFERETDSKEPPRGGLINARLNRPYTLNKVGQTEPSDTPIADDFDGDGTVDPQPYRFETAALPAAVTIGGHTFRTRSRILVASGNGLLIPQQYEPEWEPFEPVHQGSIVPGGKLVHNIQMDDLNGSPTEAEAERRLLRMRYTGRVVSIQFTIEDVGPDADLDDIYEDDADATRQFRVLIAKVDGDGETVLVTEQIAGATPPDTGAGTLNLVTGGGDATIAWSASALGSVILTGSLAAATSDSGASWFNGHDRLVPGSILMTLPSSGGVLRDNGRGRLVGADGDGYVNYVTGAYEVSFNSAETGDLLVSYEHRCPYFPIDVDVSWDWLLI